MPKRPHRIRPYLAPVSIGILGAVTAAEWILSSGAVGPPAIPFYNRLYPYVMFRPHENTGFISHDVNLASNIMSRNQRVVHHFSNQDGLRVEALDYDLPKRKPPGQWRAAVLGSSAVQLGTTYKDSLPGALRTVLRRHHPGRDIEVINAGIQSAVSRQTIAHLLFTVKDYAPDLVVLYDGFNDLMLPLNYESRPNFPYNFQTLEAAWEQYRNEHQAPLWRVILERSHLYQGLRARFSSAGEPKPGLYVGPNARSPEEILRDPEWVRRHVTAYLSNWEKLIKLSRAMVSASCVCCNRRQCSTAPSGRASPPRDMVWTRSAPKLGSGRWGLSTKKRLGKSSSCAGATSRRRFWISATSCRRAKSISGTWSTFTMRPISC